MRRFFRFVGWVITTAGILFSLLACWGLIYWLLVPDTSGAGAGHILYGVSTFLLLFIGLPMVTAGAIVLRFTAKRAANDVGQSI